MSIFRLQKRKMATAASERMVTATQSISATAVHSAYPSKASASLRNDGFHTGIITECSNLHSRLVVPAVNGVGDRKSFLPTLAKKTGIVNNPVQFIQT